MTTRTMPVWSPAQYELCVRSTRWWMYLMAPVACPMFIRNHGILMRLGAEGLAGQESIDLSE